MNGCFEKIATTSQSLELLGRCVYLCLTSFFNARLLEKIVMVQGDVNGRRREASPHFSPSVVRLLLPYLSFNIQ